MILNSYAKINLSLEVISRREGGYHDIWSVMQGIDLHDEVEVVALSESEQSAWTGSILSGASDEGAVTGSTIDNLSEQGAVTGPTSGNPSEQGAVTGSNIDEQNIVTGTNESKISTNSCFIGDINVKFCMDCDTIPSGRDNLAIRGAEAVINHLPADAEVPRHLGISIKKMLPVAAGIAGGSGNAAVCMLAVNALTGYRLTLRELMDIGISVGSDIPFSIMMNAYMNSQKLQELTGIEEASSAAIVSGIGELVEPVLPHHFKVIMMNPGVAVSTKEVYEALDSLTDRVICKDLFFNIMEEYTLRNYSEAAMLKEAMLQHFEADYVLMSGSGPTIAAYYSDEDAFVKDYNSALDSDWLKAGWRIWKSETGR